MSIERPLIVDCKGLPEDRLALLSNSHILALTGLDKRFKTLLVDRSPQWLTDLATRF